jgi:hypothetical protein
MPRPPLFRSISAWCVVACVVTASAGRAAFAQTSALIDEGTFMVSRNGAALGRESFRIVRAPAPGGQVYRATCQSALGDNRVTTSLGTDSVGVPVSYEFELTQRGVVVQQLRGQGRPGRFMVLVRTKSGESAREYVSSNGSLLIDEDVLHHHFFVPLAAAQHKALNVIVPNVAQQPHFKIEDVGDDTVDVGGRSIPSRHFTLTGPSGVVRDVWVDARGRLLKVTIPDRGLLALRDDPPR